MNIKFKRNGTKKVLAYNSNNIRPHLTHEDWMVRTVSFTKQEIEKLYRLQKKYKITRSAIVRILLESVEE